jgi:5,10-methenyltetrahydrofolate synthetase
MQDWKEINAWRKAERVTLIERRMRVPLAQRRSWSAVIEEHLDRLIRERAARTIGFYWPFKAEFDPRPLIRRLLDDGRHAALPVVLAPRTPMEFRRWTPDAEMDVGVYDIPFPKARDILLPDLVLAPPVGFDAARYRLGYGGGSAAASFRHRSRFRARPPDDGLSAAARSRDGCDRHRSRRLLAVLGQDVTGEIKRAADEDAPGP